MLVGDYDVKINAYSPNLTIKLKRNSRQALLEEYWTRKCVGLTPKICFLDRQLRLPLTGFTYQPSITNEIASAMHRYGADMPTTSPLDAEFEAFAKCVIHTLPKLTKDDLIPFEQWVSKYPKKRQEYLRKIHASIEKTDASFATSASFLKAEQYAEPKIPRSINAPSDEAKVILGPLQESIDKKMFKSRPDVFVKGSDPLTWPDRLENILGDLPCVNTDFSSFECHHRGRFANVIWYWQMHMLRDVHKNKFHKNLICALIKGKNVCRYRNSTASIVETLMSGVAWTSSANGVLNWLINCYLSAKHLMPNASPSELALYSKKFKCQFEGDDGIFEDVGVPDSLIAQLSIRLDFQRKRNYTEAHFCSQVIDRQERMLCYDWRKMLMKISCIPIKWKGCKDATEKTLLRGMALSYQYLYARSPVVSAIILKILDLTRGHDVRKLIAGCSLDQMTLDRMTAAGRAMTRMPEISAGTRSVYEQAFGLSPSEQIRLETEILASKDETTLLDMSTYWTVLQTDAAIRFNHSTAVCLPPQRVTTYTYKNTGRRTTGAQKPRKDIRLEHSLYDITRNGLKPKRDKPSEEIMSRLHEVECRPFTMDQN